MKAVLLFTFLALALVSTQVSGQVRSLEFLLYVSNEPNEGIRYSDMDVRIAPGVIRRCSKLCTFGLWAMYTAVNYGAANPSAVTVHPVKGCSRSDCTTSLAASVIRTIFSFRQIAALKTTANPDGEGVEVCPSPYFIGACIIKFSDIKDPTTIRSFGIQDQTAANIYKVCDKVPTGAFDRTARCLCLTFDNGPFLVPSLESWPPGNPIMTIAVFERGTACDGEQIIG